MSAMRYVLTAQLFIFAATSLKPTHAAASSITYHFDGDARIEAETSRPGDVRSIFRNPVIASGISSGTQAINQSVEALMASIFYSLLDNELVYDLNDATNFTIQLKRDVYTTEYGSYVIADRFSVGPRYFQELTRVSAMPLDLNAQTSSNVFNIYLRSDATRLAQNEDSGFFRRAANNWFGLLPVLTRILPPAFNPNVLYDPLAQLENPFIMPLKAELFFTMPVGSIRSYSWSGGITVPLDLAGAFDKNVADRITDRNTFNLSLPLSFFIEGEQRINVLRRGEHTAWVGLSNLQRVGSSLSLDFGNTWSILNRLTKYWSGVDVPIYPTQIEALIAHALKKDQLYEFDLRNPRAQAAYEAAVNGDFTQAHALYLANVEQEQNTGVIFHFQRTEDGIERTIDNANSLFALSRRRSKSHKTAEVEIIDPDGRHYILEARHHLDRQLWDVLVGQATTRTDDYVEIKVQRAIISKDGKDTGEYTYVFSGTERNPTTLNMTLQINDHYVDAHDYQRYINDIRHFSRLTMSSIPQIPLRDENILRQRRQSAALKNPTKQHLQLHTPYTYLGSFNALAHVQLNSQALELVASHSEDRMWRALAKGFGFDRDYWADPDNRSGFRGLSHWGLYTVVYPLRFLNIRSSQAEFIKEAHRVVSGFTKLREQLDPLTKLEVVSEILNSNYPLQLTHALMELANLREVPRRVSFKTRTRGSAAEEVKRSFRSLDGRSFNSVATMPPAPPSRIAEEKLAAFFPTSLRELRTQPNILQVTLQSERLPEHYFLEQLQPQDSLEGPHIEQQYLKAYLKVAHLPANMRARFFIRMEHGGELQVGRFLLRERVISAQPEPSPRDDTEEGNSTSAGGSQLYSFWLTGPLSQLTGPFCNRALDFGGAFELTLAAAAADGAVWSKERQIPFRLQDGIIAQ